MHKKGIRVDSRAERYGRGVKFGCPSSKNVDSTMSTDYPVSHVPRSLLVASVSPLFLDSRADARVG